MKNRIFQIVLSVLAMVVATEGHAQSGVKYPYIQGGDGASNIIVSRDAAGGVPLSALHSNWSGATPTHNEKSTNNRVPAKLQVATSVTGKTSWASAASSCPSGWRVPTQREAMLIFAMRDRLANPFTGSTWLSTENSSNTGEAWYFLVNQTYRGNIYTAEKEAIGPVLCVRDVN